MAKIKSSIIKKLKEIAGTENVFHSDEDMEIYGYDATLIEHMPDIIVFPQCAEQVADIVKLGRKEGLPVIPRGAGTNLSGGSIPIRGGIALALTRMNRVLQVDIKNSVVVVEPGVVNEELQEILRPLGFFYPPDPASMKVSTLGGNIAECSGGPMCLKYGVTRDYVLGLEVVLGDGRIVRVGGMTQGSSQGLDLVRLLVGSEGCLAIVTKAILRITKQPESKKTVLAIFDAVEQASCAVSKIIAKGIVPTTLELMDNLLINCAEDHVKIGLPRDAGAMLLIEVDGFEEDLPVQVEDIIGICLSENATDIKPASTQEEVEKLWLARRTVIGAVARKRPNYSLQDVTVPRSELLGMVKCVVETSKKYDLPIGVLAHAGDGNLHPLVLFDQREPGAIDKVHAAEVEMCQGALSLGGTLSGEHGIGLLKKGFFKQGVSERTLELTRRVKEIFDPSEQINPGKILED